MAYTSNQIIKTAEFVVTDAFSQELDPASKMKIQNAIIGIIKELVRKNPRESKIAIDPAQPIFFESLFKWLKAELKSTKNPAFAFQPGRRYTLFRDGHSVATVDGATTVICKTPKKHQDLLQAFKALSLSYQDDEQDFDEDYDETDDLNDQNSNDDGSIYHTAQQDDADQPDAEASEHQLGDLFPFDDDLFSDGYQPDDESSLDSDERDDTPDPNVPRQMVPDFSDWDQWPRLGDDPIEAAKKQRTDTYVKYFDRTKQPLKPTLKDGSVGIADATQDRVKKSAGLK